jgi:hypothetical protein
VTAPTRTASFKVRAAGFPASDWLEFLKTFKARSANRRDLFSPLWLRMDGPGFTLWMSDCRLVDSRSEPPIWEIRLEALATLNQRGQACWQEVCDGIERFIQASGLERVET